MNMKELELATALFRDALHETKVYQEYLDAKEALKQDKERWETLQQYRKKRYEIQLKIRINIGILISVLSQNAQITS